MVCFSVKLRAIWFQWFKWWQWYNNFFFFCACVSPTGREVSTLSIYRQSLVTVFKLIDSFCYPRWQGVDSHRWRQQLQRYRRGRQICDLALGTQKSGLAVRGGTSWRKTELHLFLGQGLQGNPWESIATLLWSQQNRKEVWIQAETKATTIHSATAKATTKVTSRANYSGSKRKLNEFFWINKIIIWCYEKGV